MNDLLEPLTPAPQLKEAPPPRPKTALALIGIVIVAALIIGFTNLKSVQAPSPTGNQPTKNGETTGPSQRPADPTRGLALNFTSLVGNIDANDPTTLTFTVNKGSTPLLDFDVNRERVLHLYIVRKDLRYFFQVHPRFDTTSGAFSQSFSFPTSGEWRLIADVTPTGLGEATLTHDLTVQGPYTPRPLTEEKSYSQVFDDTLFELAFEPPPVSAPAETALYFTLKNPASAVVYQGLDHFMGGVGTAVILKENTLDFVPVAPALSIESDGRIKFEAVFPAGGRYRIFSQFQRQGEILTSFFTIDVK